MRYIGTISKYFHFPYEGMYSKSDIEYIEKTVTGNGYVDLLTAKSGSLSNLTLFGGTMQDDTDVLQSVVLDGATVQRNVPEGYTELDYLRNVMSSTKFNTGLEPQNGDVLELVRTAGAPTVSNYMFQSREGTQAGIYGISGSSSGGTIMGNRGSGQSIVSEILRTNGHKYYTRMSVIGTTLTLTVKDLTDKLEDTKTREITETAGGPSRYFLRGNATQAQALGTAQNVYYASISNGGVDRIRLIPAKQGDTVGFYDMVSKTFMTTFVGDEPTASSGEASAHPFAPMNIVGNNGAIKVHKNLIDKSTVVRGDINSGDGTITTGVVYRAVSDFIPILNGQTYTVSGEIRIEGDETVYSPSKPIIALYNSSKNYISGTRALQNSYTFTIDNASASYIRVERRGSPAQGSVIDLENSKFQFQVGPYQTAYEEGYGAYIEGQTETVQDTLGNTATADFLMKLSSYKDTQEVLTGNITKNTTYLVLDGTEARYFNGDTPLFILSNAIPNGVGTSSDTLKCTHFVYSGIGGTNDNQGIRVYSNALFVRYDSVAPATADGLIAFKKFLSDQYAQGTPVIVACGVSVSTTDSVEGQELITKPITQTAGSISNMTITVTSDGGTPTPSTPKDIICNNGKIVAYAGNKFDTTGQTTGYVLGSTDGLLYQNAEYTVTEYQILRAGTYKGNFTSTSSGSRYFRCWSYTADGTPIEMIFNEKETGSTVNFTFTLATDTRVRMSYNINRHSNLSINPQDITYTEGNVETVEDEIGNTATAEDLYKIGDYVDTQEVLTGAVERKIGVRAFDGTENWSRNDKRVELDLGDNYNGNDSLVICTHYKGYTAGTSISNLPDMACKFANTSTGSLLIKDSVHNTTLEEWKSYVASEYQNGTPIIIVYQLSTPTTETTTAQTLNVKSGTNKIEIVQASIDNLGISATYLSRE